MHILHSLAISTPTREVTPMPSDSRYDFRVGAWVDSKGSALALDPAFELQTKKMDIETGEDQKGQ